jgi:hypothetical protein
MTEQVNILLSSALYSKFDCSYLGNPLRLLSVIKRASAQSILMLLDVVLDAFALIPAIYGVTLVPICP